MYEIFITKEDRLFTKYTFYEFANKQDSISYDYDTN